MTEDGHGAIRLGLFDIMQIDRHVDDDPGAMYRRRLDDLAMADDLGFDVAFCAERHFLPTHAVPSATAWLAAASQRTTRMRLGVMAYTLPIRHPVQLAEDVAVLDILSGGRLEVGFGIGHRAEELVALGVDPGRRVQVFQERLAVMRALWSGGQVTYQRGDLQLHKLAVSPLPVQVPHPPLWYAGTEPGAAQWMGAQGLGLAVGFKTADELKPTIAAYCAGREAMSQEAKDAEPHRRSGTIAMMRAVVAAGTDEAARRAVIEELVRVREDGSAEASRPDRYREAEASFDALVASEVMIAGSAETVTRAIRDVQAELGFDLFLANVYPMGADPERVRESLRLLGGPVRQALAS